MGIVGRVVQMLDMDRHIAEVEIGGTLRRVNAALVDDGNGLAPGTYVLINIGMAVEILDEQDALDHLRLLEELEKSFTEDPVPAS